MELNKPKPFLNNRESPHYCSKTHCSQELTEINGGFMSDIPRDPQEVAAKGSIDPIKPKTPKP